MSVTPTASDDDDFDIYGDLFESPRVKQVEESEDTRSLKTQISQLLLDVEALRNSNKSLIKLNKNLSCNISVLFKTAVAEIKRKEEVIDNLRRERDNIVFRRKGRNRVQDASKPTNSCLSIKSSEDNLPTLLPGRAAPKIISEPKIGKLVSKQPSVCSQEKKSITEIWLDDDATLKDHIPNAVTLPSTIKEVPKKRKVIVYPDVTEDTPAGQKESVQDMGQVSADRKTQGIEVQNRSAWHALGHHKSPSTRRGSSPNVMVKSEPDSDKLMKRRSSFLQNEESGRSHKSPSIETSTSLKTDSEFRRFEGKDGSQSTSAHSAIDTSPRNHDLKSIFDAAGNHLSPAETVAKVSIESRDECVKVNSPIRNRLSLRLKTSQTRKQGNEATKQNLVSEMASDHSITSSPVMSKLSKGQENLEDEAPMVNSALSSLLPALLPTKKTEVPPQPLLKEDITTVALETLNPMKTNVLLEDFEPALPPLPPLPEKECAPLPPPPPTFHETHDNPTAVSQFLLPVTVDESKLTAPSQPPLPKENPMPLPPLPGGTPPPSPLKKVPIIVERKTSLKSTGQLEDKRLAADTVGNLTGSTSFVPIMNPKETGLTAGACSDENLYLQCPFKSRRRVKAITVIEDSSDVMSHSLSNGSRSVKIETNSKLNKSPDKYKRMPLRKSEFHENRLCSDFRSYQSQRSANTGRHFSSFKSFAHLPERRSPSELLNGRSGRIDRISHQDKVRIRLHDRRSRSLSPHRNKMRQNGYRSGYAQKGTGRDNNMKIRTNDESGKSDKIRETMKPKSLSPRKKSSTQKKKEEPAVKRKIVELFGDSSPEPEEKKPKYSFRNSKSVNVVAATEEQESPLVAFSRETSTGSKSVPTTNKIDSEGDIIVVKRRPRSNIRLGNSEDAFLVSKPISSSTPFAKNVDHLSLKQDQDYLNVKSTKYKGKAPKC